MKSDEEQLPTTGHVIVSLKSPDAYRKFCHRLRVNRGRFKPDCGTRLETPAVVRESDIEIGEGVTDIGEQYARCSQCNWSDGE